MAQPYENAICHQHCQAKKPTYKKLPKWQGGISRVQVLSLTPFSLGKDDLAEIQHLLGLFPLGLGFPDRLFGSVPLDPDLLPRGEVSASCKQENDQQSGQETESKSLPAANCSFQLVDHGKGLRGSHGGLSRGNGEAIGKS
jgi:hypothetical protein